MERPTETLCVCGKVFQQPQRSQGGGKRTIYCSAKCRSREWARGNPKKRKATILKYEKTPENLEAKSKRQRNYTLKKYGWTEAQFQHQLKRQNYACYGCLAQIDEKSARIDHSHKTGKVRGLLCDNCNWVLGHAYDEPGTLRRLMAYLDHRIDKTNIYIIGALKNTRIPDIGNVLRSEGYDVMDEWFTPGELADTNWQEYERKRGRSYAEAIRGRAATNIFWFDRSYIDHSDIVIMVAPAGKSAMIELGYAKGRGKTTIIFLDGEDPERYDIMPGFADFIVKDGEELLEIVKGLSEQVQGTLKEAA